MNDVKKASTSVVTIVISFCLFFPLGFVLLYRRFSDKYGKYIATTKMLIICGIFLVFFGIVGLSTFFDTKETSDLTMSIIMFILPGVICLYFWYKRYTNNKKYKIYLNYISVRKKTKLQNLCNSLNVDFDTAVNILTDMINKKMVNGYLTDDELIITDVSDVVSSMMNDELSQKKETKVVKCKACGAKNTIIVGEKKECDYCGTLLQ